MRAVKAGMADEGGGGVLAGDGWVGGRPDRSVDIRRAEAPRAICTGACPRRRTAPSRGRTMRVASSAQG